MFNEEEDEEATLGAVRYPVMPSLVALQQMRNRLHLAYLGKKLMKWTAMATNKEMRRIALEISNNLKEYGTRMQLGFILLARSRYFVPHLNSTVLECVPKVATITVRRQQRSVSGVKVHNLVSEDSDEDPYPYLGLNNGGMCIGTCKDLWEDLIKLMILIVQHKITFVQIELANKNANKKKNVLSRCIIPRILITMRYILSELDEREREETFRLKRFKQLKYKKVGKGEQKPHLEPEEETVHPPKKVKPLEEKPPAEAEYIKPEPKTPAPKIPEPTMPQPKKPELKRPEPKEVTPITSICSCKELPQVEEQPSGYICPLCHLEEDEESGLRVKVCSRTTPRTAPPKERLEHLMAHINQLIQLLEQFNVEAPLPCRKKQELMKCCEAMKCKIEELSYPPPPCDFCLDAAQQSEQPPPESPCMTVQASFTSSCVPSICGKLAPSRKSSKSTPQTTAPGTPSKLMPKSSESTKQDKYKLGYFETEYKEIVRVTRSLNPDGTLNEEKQVITVKTERRNPRPKNKKGEFDDKNYSTPCRRSDSDYGGGGGFSGGGYGGGRAPSDGNRSCREGGVCQSTTSVRYGGSCGGGGSQRGTGGDGGRGLKTNLSCSEGGVCRSQSTHLAAIDYTSKSDTLSCKEGGVCKAPSRTPCPSGTSICKPCGPRPTATCTTSTTGIPPRKPCTAGGICSDDVTSGDIMFPYKMGILDPSQGTYKSYAPSSQSSVRSNKSDKRWTRRTDRIADNTSKASRSSTAVRTCKECGICTIVDSNYDSGYNTEGTSFGSGSQGTCGKNRVITEYVTTICQSGEDDVDDLNRDSRTIGCGSSFYQTTTFLSGFNPHPPGYTVPLHGAVAVSKSTTTSLKHYDNAQSTSGCSCGTSGAPVNRKTTSTTSSESSSVVSNFKPIAELRDLYCGTDIPMCMNTVSASTSAQSCWNYPLRKMCDKSTFCIPDCSTKPGILNKSASLADTSRKEEIEDIKTLTPSSSEIISKDSKDGSLTNTSCSIKLIAKPRTSCAVFLNNKDYDSQVVLKGCMLNALKKMLMSTSTSTQCSDMTLVTGVDSVCSCRHSKSETCEKCAVKLQNNPTCYTYLELRDFDLENETCVSCGTLGQFSSPSASIRTEDSVTQSSPSQETIECLKNDNSGNSFFSECKSICATLAKQIRSKCCSPLPSEVCCPKPGAVRKPKVAPRRIPTIDAMTSTRRCDRFDCRPLLAFNRNHTCAKIRKKVCACHSDSHVAKKINLCPVVRRRISCCDYFYRYC